MADLDRIELLIGLSNNMRAENEEWRREVFREGQQRAKRVIDMIARFEAEYAALDQEKNMMAHYLPRQVQDPRQIREQPQAAAATRAVNNKETR